MAQSLHPRKEPPYLLNSRLGECQCWSGLITKQGTNTFKISTLPPVYYIRTPQKNKDIL